MTTDALAISRVRTILERELEKRRGGISVEGAGDENELGGLECTGQPGAAFKFSDWEGGEVTFLATNVRVGEAKSEKENDVDGLNPLREWLVNDVR